MTALLNILPTYQRLMCISQSIHEDGFHGLVDTGRVCEGWVPVFIVLHQPVKVRGQVGYQGKGESGRKEVHVRDYQVS